MLDANLYRRLYSYIPLARIYAPRFAFFSACVARSRSARPARSNGQESGGFGAHHKPACHVFDHVKRSQTQGTHSWRWLLETRSGLPNLRDRGYRPTLADNLRVARMVATKWRSACAYLICINIGTPFCGSRTETRAAGLYACGFYGGGKVGGAGESHTVIKMEAAVVIPTARIFQSAPSGGVPQVYIFKKRRPALGLSLPSC